LTNLAAGAEEERTPIRGCLPHVHPVPSSRIRRRHQANPESQGHRRRSLSATAPNHHGVGHRTTRLCRNRGRVGGTKDGSKGPLSIIGRQRRAVDRAFSPDASICQPIGGLGCGRASWGESHPGQATPSLVTVPTRPRHASPMSWTLLSKIPKRFACGADPHALRCWVTGDPMDRARCRQRFIASRSLERLTNHQDDRPMRAVHPKARLRVTTSVPGARASPASVLCPRPYALSESEPPRYATYNFTLT
jgi:hypothetical protein